MGNPMVDSETKKLKQLQRRVGEAKLPEEKARVLVQFLNQVGSYAAENERLVEDLSPTDLKKNEEEMRARLDAWDVEARQILEREISDPKMLQAALDNSRYKEEVIALAGTPFSKFVADVKHPSVDKADELKERVEKQKRIHAEISQSIMWLRWLFVVGAVALIIWVLWNES